jgi:putative ABC transport system ATP-binding protein
VSGGAVIELRAVTRRYRRGAEVVIAVREVSMIIAAGVVTVVAGASGAGKTTLLGLVARWERPDAGEVLGLPARPSWAEVAALPQTLGLLGHLTLRENVELPGRAVPLARDPADVMGALGVAHLVDRFPAEASLGEQQRVACARAVVARSRLIVADEPTSHQDDASASRVLEQLEEAAAAGAAVLVATHDERVIASAGRLHWMADGVVTAADRSGP